MKVRIAEGLAAELALRYADWLAVAVARHGANGRAARELAERIAEEPRGRDRGDDRLLRELERAAALAGRSDVLAGACETAAAIGHGSWRSGVSVAELEVSSGRSG